MAAVAAMHAQLLGPWVPNPREGGDIDSWLLQGQTVNLILLQISGYIWHQDIFVLDQASTCMQCYHYMF